MNNPIRFGIISEGQTDQMVLDNILHGYFDDLEGNKILINPVHPDQGETYGGWTRFLNYIQSIKFQNALASGFNDYYILQIDTDICVEPFGIDPISDKELHKIESFTTTIKDKIISDYLGEAIYKKYQDQFIFAISVHAIECWLLPIYLTAAKQQKLLNCIDTLQKALKQQNNKINLKAKRPRDYDKISRDFSKRKKLLKLYEKHPSLRIFIENLEDVFEELK